MAIYSLRMTAVGKTNQAQPFTAAAHLKYITRKQAVSHVLAARIPEVRRQAIAWLKREERADRKNARVVDKLVLALPRELSAAHQHALVTAFAEALTQGRASWFAAFHTGGKDRNNPHCHLILRDRDVETGRRVMFLSAGKKEAAERQAKGQSAPTTLASVRALWERCANAALQVAGRVERVDRRSLREQGIDRRPQVHEGPNIRGMHRRGFRPRSRDRVLRNSPYRRRRGSTTRVVRYAEIDRGLTRVEYNASLKQTGRVADGRVARTAVSAAAAMPVVAIGREVGRDTVREAPAFAHPQSAPLQPWPRSLPAAPLPEVPVAAVTLPVAPVTPAAAPATAPPVSPTNQLNRPTLTTMVAAAPTTAPFAAASPLPNRPLTLTEMLAQKNGTSLAQPRSAPDRNGGGRSR